MRLHRLASVLAAVALAGCTGATSAVEVQGTAPVTTGAANPSSTPSSAPGSSTTAPPPTLAPRTLTWEPCGVAGRNLECSWLEVPLDYADPTGETIKLRLERKPAKGPDRIGSLLVNPGGPGVAGTSLVDAATAAFSTDLLRRFDIVGWDPRGTGESSPIDCVDDLDPYLTIDPTPDTPAEKQELIDSAKDLAARCEAGNDTVLPHISTQDSARDMDEIRKALGEETISYFGFSYGSELGATFATMFPNSVRAMVLDGAVDPNSSVLDEARRQVVALERSLDTFLADCAADRDCAFRNGGDPGTAFDELVAGLDTRPLRVGDRELNQGKAYNAILSSLYDPRQWPVLAQALAAAQRGDGDLLLALNDAYLELGADGSFSNTFEALVAIRCLDHPGPADPAYADQIAAEFARLAPRLGPPSTYGYFCTFWPHAEEPLRVTGTGAGPIVVVGTTGDGITPIESTRLLADDLAEGVLVTVDAQGHTGYKRNRCVVSAIDGYLIDLEVPAEGLVCR